MLVAGGRLARSRRGDWCLSVTLRTIEEELGRDPIGLKCKDVHDTIYKLRTAVTEALTAFLAETDPA